MNKQYLLIICIVILAAIQSCSKKTLPAATVITTVRSDTPSVVSSRDTLQVEVKKDSPVAVKKVIRKKPRETIPKVIVVNDQYARKSVDGRLYYDLQGRRYWRSNKDGKYYLFNKSMLTDEAFKKP